jgi:hypothetical protein
MWTSFYVLFPNVQILSTQSCKQPWCRQCAHCLHHGSTQSQPAQPGIFTWSFNQPRSCSPDDGHNDARNMLRLIWFSWRNIHLIIAASVGSIVHQNIYFILSKFFRKSCRLWDNVGKDCTASHITYDNTISPTRITRWITKLQIHTLRICNAYCFSTSKMVKRTRLNDIYIHVLPLLLNR